MRTLHSQTRQSLERARATHLSLVAMLACAVASAADAATLTVNSFDDLPDAMPGDALCAASDGTCTLRAAVMTANETTGDVIELPAGTYTLTIAGTGEDLAATGDLDLTSAVTIQGPGDPSLVVIDAAGIDRAFHVVQPMGSLVVPDVDMTGVTVTGGSPGAAASGGGVLVSNGEIDVGASVLRDNRATAGSAVAVESGAIAGLFASRVEANDVDAGGDASAVFVADGGTATLVRTEVRDNEGDGAFARGGLNLDRSAVTESESAGVRLAGTGAAASVRVSTLSTNRVAGIAHDAPAPATLVVEESTIAENDLGITTAAGASTTVSESIVADNQTADCQGAATSLGFNIDSDSSCFGAAPAAGDQPGVDPLLGALLYNGGFGTRTHLLLPGSPAIDAANAAGGGSATDQRGYVRAAAAPDVGALEALVFTVDATNDAVDAIPGDGVCATGGAVCTLRAATMEASAIADPLPALPTQALRLILVPPGSYALSIAGADEDAGATGDLDLTKASRVLGLGTPRSADVSGAGLDRVLDVHPTAASFMLEGMTIRDGSIAQADVANADDATGGGVRARAATNGFIDSEIRDNGAFSGGGLAIGEPGVPGPASIFDVDVIGNRAEDTCGGVSFETGEGTAPGAAPPAGITGTIEFASIIANDAASGGGLCALGGRVAVSNATIASNGATLTAGGVFANDSALTFAFATIAENDAPTASALETVRSNAAFGTEMAASIVAANTGGDACDALVGVSVSGGGSVDEDGTCLAALANPADRVSVSAELVLDLLGNGSGELVLPPLPTSPALGLAPGALCSQFPQDQRDGLRAIGGPCDAGAVDFFCVAGPACDTGDLGVCADGLYTCPTGIDGPAVCEAQVSAGAEMCDGLDNDCDGAVDEDIPDNMTGTDVGECQMQIESCIGGSFQVTQMAIDPVAEICDGLDNDCDGTPDNGVADVVTGSDIGQCQPQIESCIGGSFQVTQIAVGPSAEICDGLDNDCSGTPDDGIDDVVTGSDVGECQSQIESCVGGTVVVVQAGIGPVAEMCDGLDNDCDGAPDEGIADMISGTDVGTCQVEIQSCVGGSFQVTQAGIGPAAEMCDGLDNNCDGAVDDGIADIVTGSDVGECQSQVESCVGGSFQVTQMQIGPSTEMCDGLDNNCDGAVDDGVADIVTGSDVGECQAQIESCVGGSFQVTQTQVGPSTEMCDGLDNNCDGAVDEGIADMVTGSDVGECRSEIQSCIGGSFQVTQTEIGPSAEMCDSLDNDCNGMADDGIAPLVSGTDVGTCQSEVQECIGGSFQVTQTQIGPVAEMCDGEDNDCDGTPDEGIANQVIGSDVGECQAQILACSDGAFREIQAQIGPSTETCDGLDNNCDGSVDDGIADMVSGSDVGECRPQILSCVGGTFTETQSQILPVSEMCDGLDNNCDGAVDDGIDPIATGTSQGACEFEIQECINGAFEVTQQQVGPSAEVCDGEDNDCDGMVDDGVANRVTGIDTGECRVMIEECQGGAFVTTQTGIGPAAEMCDGLDNDCDGANDENIPDRVTGTGLGVCQEQVEACIGGSYTVTQPGIDPTPEACDGFDNDCDGLVDDDVAPLVSGTDTGVCRSEIQECQGGSFVVVQSGILPSAEICDGEDNDCDGAADDGIANTMTGTDVGECQQEITSCQNGVLTIIQAGILPVAETCDLLDNDCNGAADDSIPDILTGSDVGECQAEIQRCVGGSVQVVQTEIGPTAEQCDGLDNDCNGSTDDQIDPIVVDGPDQGLCREEIRECIGGAFQVTQTAILPTDEMCDGEDNDCDGATDEEIDPIVGQSSDTGVCQPSIFECLSGSFTQTQERVDPSSEVCDALDNDCDGSDDEGIADIVSGTNVGICVEEIESCVGGEFIVVQQGVVEDEQETCNGLDDDCDGMVDEDIAPIVDPNGISTGECVPQITACEDGRFQIQEPAVNPTDEICNGLDDDCDGVVDNDIRIVSNHSDVGICQPMITGCRDASFFTVQPLVLPRSFDFCADDLDDDCDGEVDQEECGLVETDAWIQDIELILNHPQVPTMVAKAVGDGVEFYGYFENAPLLIGSYFRTDRNDCQARDIFYDASSLRAYVSLGNCGFDIVDLSGIAQIALPFLGDGLRIGGNDTNGFTEDVWAIDSETVAVADQNAGLRFFDVSDLTSPDELGRIGFVDAAFGNALDVQVAGGVAFVATTKGLRIVDISDLTDPSLMPGSFDFTNNVSGQDVELISTPSGGWRLYVSAREDGVYVFDIDSNHVMTELDPIPTNGLSFEMIAQGHIAVLADGEPNQGLRIFEAVPGEPLVELPGFDGPLPAVMGDQLFATDVAFDGAIAYVAFGKLVNGGQEGELHVFSAGDLGVDPALLLIPEPATALGALTALAALVALRRRGRRGSR